LGYIPQKYPLLSRQLTFVISFVIHVRQFSLFHGFDQFVKISPSIFEKCSVLLVTNISLWVRAGVMKMAHSGAMCHLYIAPDFVPIFIPGFSVQVSVLALLTPDT